MVNPCGGATLGVSEYESECIGRISCAGGAYTCPSGFQCWQNADNFAWPEFYQQAAETGLIGLCVNEEFTCEYESRPSYEGCLSFLHFRSRLPSSFNFDIDYSQAELDAFAPVVGDDQKPCDDLCELVQSVSTIVLSAEFYPRVVVVLVAIMMPFFVVRVVAHKYTQVFRRERYVQTYWARLSWLVLMFFLNVVALLLGQFFDIWAARDVYLDSVCVNDAAQNVWIAYNVRGRGACQGGL